MKTIKEKLVILTLLGAFALAGGFLGYGFHESTDASVLVANDCDKDDDEGDGPGPADNMSSGFPA